MPTRHGSTGSTESPPQEGPSFAIGHDGKIEGIYKPRDQRRTWTATENAQLELAARPERREPEQPPPARPQPSRRRTIIALAVIAAALALPLAAHFGIQLWKERKPGSAKPSGLVFIDSTPSGARLFINGEEVGRTPYVVPNTFEPGSTIPVRVVYPGAQDWSGTFRGGVDTSFTVELQPK
jgi:hypothetical protein